MTCSSSTICSRKPLSRWRASAGLLGLGLLGAGLFTWALPLRADSAPDAHKAIEQARADLAGGDGIAAEIDLKKALDAGAPRDAVAARMGEALLDQGLRGKAREWLGPGKFSPDEAFHGFRMLGLLERLEGNLEAAGNAYDRAIAIDGKNPDLWVDVGRLRYAGGEHMLAIDAADHALGLDPANVSALEFRGEIVRDQFGLAAALPWFEAALAHDPDHLQTLGEYAATLGELGRAHDMLAATRHMLELDGRNARALYLQALLAARAGDNGLARSLLAKSGNRLDGMPAAILLGGVLDLRTGSYRLAIEGLEKLVARQPANARARDLLACAYYGAGNYREVVRRFGDAAADDRATSYLLVTVGRAHEMLGERDRAAALLDRATNAQDRKFAAAAAGPDIAAMLADRNFGGAEATAERRRSASPGNADIQAQAGDVQLLAGNAAAAAERYRLAARVRMSESLMERIVAALADAGQGDAAATLAESYLAQNPSSRRARRLVAAIAAGQQDWARAAQLLGSLRDSTGGGDVRLLADLSLALLKNGDGEAAEQAAREAYRLQPSSMIAAQAWGMALAELQQRPADARALLEKARAMGGDNPMLAEARGKLGG